MGGKKEIRGSQRLEEEIGNSGLTEDVYYEYAGMICQQRKKESKRKHPRKMRSYEGYYYNDED